MLWPGMCQKRLGHSAWGVLLERIELSYSFLAHNDDHINCPFANPKPASLGLVALVDVNDGTCCNFLFVLFVHPLSLSVPNVWFVTMVFNGFMITCTSS